MDKYLNLNDLQKMFIRKQLINSVTYTLVIASIVKVLYENFDSDMLMLRDYLFTAPSLLIAIGFIRKLIKDNPIMCYRIKGIISVGGCGMLVIVELVGGSPMWYFADALIVSFIPLLTNPHRAYYSSYVADKSKDFSEVMGYTDVFGEVSRVILGLSLIYLDIKILYVLIVVLIMDAIERYYDNVIANVVFSEKELITEEVH
tara:strand:- start:138172 stop:138777 length:606 start_codon:yes stop_codon:yes gene_type:complete